jgi:hypothetical protein
MAPGRLAERCCTNTRRGAKRLPSAIGGWRNHGRQAASHDCDAPHAAPPGMTELIAFVCAHCDESVTVEPPKIQ